MKKIFVSIALMAFSANVFASAECLANGTKEEIIECLRRLEDQKKSSTSTKTIEQTIIDLVKQIKISL